MHNSFDYFYCIWKASGGSITRYLRKNNLFVWGVLGFGKNTNDGDLRIAVWSTAFLFFRQIFLSVKKNSSFLDFTNVIPEGFSFFRKPLPTDAHASWTGWGGCSLCYLKECGFLEVLVYAVQTATLYTLTCKYFSLICINFEPNCLYCNKIF